MDGPVEFDGAGRVVTPVSSIQDHSFSLRSDPAEGTDAVADLSKVDHDRQLPTAGIERSTSGTAAICSVRR